jgi:tetratricopeptide (TPR) repeat protein
VNPKSNKFYIWIIILATFILYGNSINNEYALDDNIVVEGNKLVEKGVVAIPEIFMSRYSTDKKQSYDYRPIVISTFAIEKQFFKHLPEKQTKEEKKRKDKLTQANVSHFINVVLYALTCILLFNFFVTIFTKQQTIFSFLITILFLAHPLHTEVVASIKNRDEMLMLIGMLLTMKYFLRYAETKQIKYYFLGILSTLFALASKNNGMALIGLVPVVLYFTKAETKTVVISFLTILFLFVGFAQIQKIILPSTQVRIYEYFENPLMYEGWSMKRISASLYFSWFYLEMLIFPKNLSFYYGYNQIPIATWGYWQVWASLLFYLSIGIYGIYSFIKREVVGLSVVFWFGLMMGVNNIKFLLPGIVADRFAFTFSIGFLIILTWLLFKIFKVEMNKEAKKIEVSNGFLVAYTIVLLAYSTRTIARNPDWHDYMTLFENDIEHLSESAKAHALISNTLYPKIAQEGQKNPNNPALQNDIQQIIYHYKESIRIDSNYTTSINNLGSVYVNFLRDYPTAIKYCSKAIEQDPNYLEAHFNLAYSYAAISDFDNSLNHFIKVLEIDPNYNKAYEMLIQLLEKNNKIMEGVDALLVVAEKSKNPKNIYINIANLYSLKSNGDYTLSIKYFEKAYQYDTTDKVLCSHIVKLYQAIGNTQKANEYLINCK